LSVDSQRLSPRALSRPGAASRRSQTSSVLLVIDWQFADRLGYFVVVPFKPAVAVSWPHPPRERSESEEERRDGQARRPQGCLF